MWSRSIFGRLLGVLDHEDFHGPSLGFQLQAELIQDPEERRSGRAFKG
jgi:hypothetical protein